VVLTSPASEREWYFDRVGIVGDHPETGVRISLERPREANDPPFAYAGEAAVPDATFPLHVTVTAGGEVAVRVEPGPEGAPPPADLAEKVRLIVRTVVKQAHAEGGPPPRRIVRWRADRPGQG